MDAVKNRLKGTRFDRLFRRVLNAFGLNVYVPATPARLTSEIYNDAPQITRYLFIGGLHRSGTTLIEHYIHAHYDVACLRATVPESEGQHLQSVFPTGERFGGAGEFAFDPRAQFALPDDPETVRSEIMAEWSQFIVGDSDLLVEKSPPNLVRIPWLRHVFPGCQILIVTRDPRAVAGATMKWNAAGRERLLHHWDAAYSITKRDLGPDCYVIRYEDFCEDPRGAIEASGLGAVLGPPKLKAIDPRFAEIRNSNARYLPQHGRRRYGHGVWESFGYKF
ncbi:sulfotransferase family protein [Paracoccaceae bacterium GXU_MW_L88]